MSIVNVDTAEVNGVDGGTTVARFDGRIDRWMSRAVERATPRDTGLFCSPAPTATVYLLFLNI